MNTEQKTSQSRSCYEALRWQLLHGQLTAGSRLVEEKWSTHLGVNRSALREALVLLAHEGFLESGPKGGFFVPVYSESVLDEVLEVRLALEVGALEILEIRGQIPAEGLRKLDRSCDMMRQLTEAGFEYGFVEADRMFHEALVAMAGNSRLLRVYRQAPLPLNPLPNPDMETRRRNMRETLGEHLELCQRIKEGRIREAIELLRDHLLTGHKIAKETSVP
jgi:DNA-binding GntR family transcriptional regulator